MEDVLDGAIQAVQRLDGCLARIAVPALCSFCFLFVCFYARSDLMFCKCDLRFSGFFFK
jgi:hypothetical protein